MKSKKIVDGKEMIVELTEEEIKKAHEELDDMQEEESEEDNKMENVSFYSYLIIMTSMFFYNLFGIWGIVISIIFIVLVRLSVSVVLRRRKTEEDNIIILKVKFILRNRAEILGYL